MKVSGHSNSPALPIAQQLIEGLPANRESATAFARAIDADGRLDTVEKAAAGAVQEAVNHRRVDGDTAFGRALLNQVAVVTSGRAVLAGAYPSGPLGPAVVAGREVMDAWSTAMSFFSFGIIRAPASSTPVDRNPRDLSKPMPTIYEAAFARAVESTVGMEALRDLLREFPGATRPGVSRAEITELRKEHPDVVVFDEKSSWTIVVDPSVSTLYRSLRANADEGYLDETDPLGPLKAYLVESQEQKAW